MLHQNITLKYGCDNNIHEWWQDLSTWHDTQPVEIINYIIHVPVLVVYLIVIDSNVNIHLMYNILEYLFVSLCIIKIMMSYCIETMLHWSLLSMAYLDLPS